MAVIKQKIVPHLWFDKEAKEAANFYCSIFRDSKVTSITTLHDTPSGVCDVVSVWWWVITGDFFEAHSENILSILRTLMPSFVIGEKRGRSHELFSFQSWVE